MELRGLGQGPLAVRNYHSNEILDYTKFKDSSPAELPSDSE